MNCSTHSATNKHQHLQRPRLFLMRAAALYLCLFILFTPASAQENISEKNIAIIYLQDTGFSHELIKNLETDIGNEKFNIKKIPIKNALYTQLKEQDFVIALGSKVTKSLVESDIKKPTLSLLISRDFAEAIVKEHPDATNISMLLIEHPIKRYFRLISEILGDNHKAGLILGTHTQHSEKLFKQVAAESNQTLITRHIEQTEQLTPALKSLSKETDVLLALPDPDIYNRRTIRNILLSSYRYKLPIIGFSKAYVKAGAIAAIYSKPEQMSSQATEIINQFCIENNFNTKIHNPTNFSISLNHKVARSMSIRLPEISAITEKIKKTEMKP